MSTIESSPTCQASSKPGRTLSLPVVTGDGAGGNRNAWSKGHKTIKHSRMGKWRAAVLIGVHVLMAIHIIQWLVTGLTVSPVEPSESMHTLRDGVVNAGFVFFVLAILSTLIFGRFFCGWGCHIVAVQDLAAWIMMKLGVKPKPFRSRLMLWIPLGLALYMFVWPVFVREVMRPLLADSRGRLPAWLGQIDPLPGIHTDFLVEDFWATFAAWYVAIPFILVCGVFTVYVLGAKAFCSYGCPYGGFFAPVDRFAPGRIRVNDNCHQCGHCTAVCTSNVRVHEEVRDYGMVVDPGCMKCLDCVSVCPNNALSFGFGAPAIGAKVRPGAEQSAAKAKALREARYDLSRTEEVIVLVLFLIFFQSFRGMFNQVPMLMAVAMGGLQAWALWKCWRLLRDENSRLHNFQFKYRGKLKPVGVAFLALTLACAAAGLWSGYVRWETYRAEIAYQKLDTPIGVIMRSDFAPTPDSVEQARTSLAHYMHAAPPSQGGVGWPLRADDWVNIAYLRLILGDKPGAEQALGVVIDIGHPRDSLIFQLEQIMTSRGATPDEIRGMFQRALLKHDDLWGVRDRLLRERLEKDGEKAKADVLAELKAALDRHPRSVEGPLIVAGLYRDLGDAPGALALVDRALKQHDPSPDELLRSAGVLSSLNQPERALDLIQQAQKKAKKDSGPRMMAAQMLARMGRKDDALAAADAAVERSDDRGVYSGKAGAFISAGVLKINLDKPDDGLALVRRGVKLVEDQPWELAPVGMGLVDTGMRTRNVGLIQEGVKVLTMARDAEPAAPTIHHDLAQVYYALERPAEALESMKKAAELGTSSALLAERYAVLLREQRRFDEAEKWFKEARRRSGQPESKPAPPSGP